MYIFGRRLLACHENVRRGGDQEVTFIHDDVKSINSPPPQHSPIYCSPTLSLSSGDSSFFEREAIAKPQGNVDVAAAVKFSV